MNPIDARHVVRGQYEGYRAEKGVAPDSETETFVALRAEVDNWRWAGVPFYLRTGKALAQSRQMVVIGLRQPTLRMFPVDRRATPGGRGNEVVVDFADPGSIHLHFLAKVPGPEMRLGPAAMVFRYSDSFDAAPSSSGSAMGLEAYERLILEAMLGDQSLFARSDEIERLWEVSTSLLEHPPPVEPYPRGSWGPPSADRIPAPHRWYPPEP
jgi:glucose-6-phosphate 1-dehydrogenase